jgi:hypothetical protein
MKMKWTGFNLYLLLLGGLLAGCQTHKDKTKELVSTFRLHIETGFDPSGGSDTVAIYRENPLTLNVAKAPALTESDVSEAKVVESLGDFSIQVQFDRGGTWRLEQATTAYRGKHMAVFTQFMPSLDAKKTETRWLAAPRITKRITNGIIIFTPDCTRKEADQIVKGINNVATKAHKDILGSS